MRWEIRSRERIMDAWTPGYKGNNKADQAARNVATTEPNFAVDLHPNHPFGRRKNLEGNGTVRKCLDFKSKRGFVG